MLGKGLRDDQNTRARPQSEGCPWLRADVRRDQKIQSSPANATVRNNCLECDHSKLERLIVPTLGFQSM
jgi:hypothetical protein